MRIRLRLRKKGLRHKAMLYKEISYRLQCIIIGKGHIPYLFKGVRHMDYDPQQ